VERQEEVRDQVAGREVVDDRVEVREVRDRAEDRNAERGQVEDQEAARSQAEVPKAAYAQPGGRIQMEAHKAVHDRTMIHIRSLVEGPVVVHNLPVRETYTR
jgi:hypothetical protein